jgi:hypothetical protein
VWPPLLEIDDKSAPSSFTSGHGDVIHGCTASDGPRDELNHGGMFDVEGHAKKGS